MITLIVDLLVFAGMIFGVLVAYKSARKLIRNWGSKDMMLTTGELVQTASEALGVAVGVTAANAAGQVISRKLWPESSVAPATPSQPQAPTNVA